MANGKLWPNILTMAAHILLSDKTMEKNGIIWRIIAILLVAFLAVCSVIYAYGGRNRDIADNTKRIDKHEVKIDKLEEAVIEQTTHYGHIKDALEKIEGKLP